MSKNMTKTKLSFKINKIIHPTPSIYFEGMKLNKCTYLHHCSEGKKQKEKKLTDYIEKESNIALLQATTPTDETHRNNTALRCTPIGDTTKTTNLRHTSSDRGQERRVSRCRLVVRVGWQFVC